MHIHCFIYSYILLRVALISLEYITLLHIGHYDVTMAKISILKLQGIIKKIS